MAADGLSRAELNLFSRLDTPGKIQDFLNAIPINREPEGDTCLSPRRVLRERRAHCIEGAMLAAAIFRHHGQRPLIVDMEAAMWDDDHVIAVFRRHGAWGAISKTNHATLRYREPVYRTIRELVMSYFHEYTPVDGDRKSLRSFSGPVDLSRFDRLGWMTDEQNVWYVPEYLIDAKHRPILNRGQIASLRRSDPIEVRAAGLLEWP
jgi:hypothetical protein